MGMARSIKIIVLFIFLFIVATIALTLFGYTGYTYLFVMGVIGIAWLWAGVDGIYSSEPKIWARKTFFYSLVVILVFSLMTALGHRLP
jgi:protoheme IX farnesyltransferase